MIPTRVPTTFRSGGFLVAEHPCAVELRLGTTLRHFRGATRVPTVPSGRITRLTREQHHPCRPSKPSACLTPSSPRSAPRASSPPFPIQALTMSDALAGRDVTGKAETGSGKTIAFGIPMLVRAGPGQFPPAGRPRPGAHPRAGGPDHRRAATARRGGRPPCRRRVRRRADGSADQGAPPRPRRARRHAGPPDRPHAPRRRRASRASVSSPSTKPTAWPTSASCRRSSGSCATSRRTSR